MYIFLKCWQEYKSNKFWINHGFLIFWISNNCPSEVSLTPEEESLARHKPCMASVKSPTPSCLLWVGFQPSGLFPSRQHQTPITRSILDIPELSESVHTAISKSAQLALPALPVLSQTENKRSSFPPVSSPASLLARPGTLSLWALWVINSHFRVS